MNDSVFVCLFVLYDMPRRKRKTKKEKEEEVVQEENQHSVLKGILALTLFVIVAIVVLSFFNQGGKAGELIRDSLDAVIGVGRYGLPLVVLLCGVLFATRVGGERSNSIAFASIGFFFAFLGFLSFISVDAGVVGEGLSSALSSIVGTIGGFLVIMALLVATIIVGFNISLLHVLQEWRKKESQEQGDVAFQEEEETPFEKAHHHTDGESAEPQLASTSPVVIREKQHDTQEGRGAQKTAFAAVDARFRLPPFDLLKQEEGKPLGGNIQENARAIQKTFQTFGISVDMGEVNVGPTVTQYTIKPADGIRLSKITALTNDVALALAARSLRIEAPIPGRSLVGLEVPNKTTALVRLRALIERREFQEAGDLAIALGRDVSGKPVYSDLTKMPHLLIAGSTGSGKTIAVTTVIMSLLYRNTPQQLRLILIDPKRVEFGVYANIPHLLAPVVTESSKAINALKWAVAEMERRFDIFNRVGARDIGSYHKNKEAIQQEGPLPYLVVIIDEFADLMAVKGKEVEGLVVRIAQLARAAGIHLIVATQRPSVEVITGTIKANLPSRMSFSVASQIDSRTILDAPGAEKLLGKGDMLFIPPQSSTPIRIQGAFVQDSEVKKVADFIRSQSSAKESDMKDFAGEQKASDPSSLSAVDFDSVSSSSGAGDPSQEDALYNEAKDIVIASKKASASLLQRRLRVGYARAARLLDLLEENNVIGPADGARPREVYALSEEEQYGGPVAPSEPVDGVRQPESHPAQPTPSDAAPHSQQGGEENDDDSLSHPQSSQHNSTHNHNPPG